MKQIVKKVSKIDFLKVAEVILAAILVLAPLSAAAIPLPTCSSLNGVNCTAGTSITGLITTIINWMLALAGLIAVFFLVVGGFRYIAAGGNEESAEKGRSTVINAIIGIVIIVLSYVIVNVVSNLVTNVGGGTSGTGI